MNKLDVRSFKAKRLLNPFNEILKKYKKCAIILSSPALLNNEYGEWINSHDCVMRFNFAPTTGYEKYVGSKTTYRLLGGFLGQSTYYKEDQDQNVARWTTGNDDIMGYEKADLNNFINTKSSFFDTFFYMYCDSFKYNSGHKLISLIKKEENLPEINIFGYLKQKNNTYNQYHYYNEKENIEKAKQIMEKYKLPNPWNGIESSAYFKKAYRNHDYNASEKVIEEKQLNKILNIV